MRTRTYRQKFLHGFSDDLISLIDWTMLFLQPFLMYVFGGEAAITFVLAKTTNGRRETLHIRLVNTCSANVVQK